MAAGAGEVVVVMSGDGLVGQVGGAARQHRGQPRRAARRARQRLRPRPRDPDRRRRGRRRARGRPHARDRRRRGRTASASWASRAVGSTRTRTGSPTRPSGSAARPCTSTRRSAPSPSGSPPASRSTLDGERARLHRLWRRRQPTAGPTAAACTSRPDAELDDGLLDVVWIERDRASSRFLTRVLPKVFNGTHVENPEVSVRRAGEVRIEADRPFAVYADGDHLTDLPATVRLLRRALRVIAPEGVRSPAA